MVSGARDGTFKSHALWCHSSKFDFPARENLQNANSCLKTKKQECGGKIQGHRGKVLLDVGISFSQ